MIESELTIEVYTPGHKPEWNLCVKESRNGTFLHNRDYMDYHADRFKDCSLIVRNSKGKIIGLFAAAVPVNDSSSVVYSHPGLTYGGLILPYSTTSLEIKDIISAILEYYKIGGFKELIYKPIPHIYHRSPSEDDIYFLMQHGAVIKECLLSSTIASDQRPECKENMRRNISKAKKNNISYTLAESEDEWLAFYTILSQVLESRHSTRPVHTFDELRLLHSRFPENIKLWTAKTPDETIQAGVVMYLTDKVAHSQYIASSPAGFRTNALSGLLNHLVTHYGRERSYFDFGISTEDHGKILNEGLIRQKNGLGGRGTVTITLHITL